MIKVNGYKVFITNFPNGESFIKDKFSKTLYKDFEITMIFESDVDLVHLMMIMGQIEDVGGVASLYMPYVPYSRMDRTEGQTVFTLKYICKLINDLMFTKVTILEPHSDVCVALLDRVEVVNSTIDKVLPMTVRYTDFDLKNDYIVFPDSGAEKRYSKQVKSENILTAIKHRDFATGYIKSLDIIGEAPQGFNAIIVDDLCSKGGTFMLTANKLKEMGADKIYLAITHCENTILEGDVLKETSPIDGVFATNSIFNKINLQFDSLEIEKLYGKGINMSKLHILEVD